MNVKQPSLRGSVWLVVFAVAVANLMEGGVVLGASPARQELSAQEKDKKEEKKDEKKEEKKKRRTRKRAYR